MTNMDDNGRVNSYFWISMPPIPTLLIALLLLPFSDPSERLEMGGAFWLFVTMVYLSLSAGYVICLGRGAREDLGILQALSQGVALLILPLGIGAPRGLSWVGFALSFCGTVLLVNRANKLLKNYRKKAFDGEKEDVTRIPEEVPIPTLTYGEDGAVLRANREMLDLLDMEEELILGQKAETFFPPEEDRITIKDREWRIMRNPGENGSELIYLIEEIPQSENPEEPEAGDYDPQDMIHGPTGLFSAQYAERIAPAELKRAVRYKRWLSFILLKVSVVSMDQDKSEVAKISEDLYNRYGDFIMKHTRECDLGFYLGNGLYLVLLPETPGQGAKVALEKLKKIPDDIKGVLTGDASASLAVSLYNCSGQEKVDFNSIFSELMSSLSVEVQFEPLAPNL